MREVSSLLARLWLDELRLIEAPGRHSIKDWLAAGHYGITSQPTATSFQIQIHRTTDFTRPLAHEINKWSSAVHETLAAINEDTIHNKANAWACIQLYYAAFFAAHAILRFYGNGCCQLTSKQTSVVSSSAVASGYHRQQPNSGLYLLSYDSSLKVVKARLLDDSHADTWSSFADLLQRLSLSVGSVTALSSTKLAAASSLDSLISILKRDGNARGAWLSAFRNRVNYQKSDGLWYPYGKNIPTRDEMIKLIDRWRNSRASFSLNRAKFSDVEAFIEAATAVVWLSRELLLRLHSMKPNTRHFLDVGGLDFLRFANWHS